MLARRSELFQLASAAFLKWDARFLNGKRGGKIQGGAPRGALYTALTRCHGVQAIYPFPVPPSCSTRESRETKQFL